MKEVKHIKTPGKGTKKINFQKKEAPKKSTPSPQTHISRDVEEGNIPNYCQTINCTLLRSIAGYPICNYCGLTAHKRQFCSIKMKDREMGLKRKNHPDKGMNMAAVQAIPWQTYSNPTTYY